MSHISQCIQSSIIPLSHCSNFACPYIHLFSSLGILPGRWPLCPSNKGVCASGPTASPCGQASPRHPGSPWARSGLRAGLSAAARTAGRGQPKRSVLSLSLSSRSLANCLVCQRPKKICIFFHLYMHIFPPILLFHGVLSIAVKYKLKQVSDTLQ